MTNKKLTRNGERRSVCAPVWPTSYVNKWDKRNRRPEFGLFAIWRAIILPFKNSDSSFCLFLHQTFFSVEERTDSTFFLSRRLNWRCLIAEAIRIKSCGDMRLNARPFFMIKINPEGDREYLRVFTCNQRVTKAVCESPFFRIFYANIERKYSIHDHSHPPTPCARKYQKRKGTHVTEGLNNRVVPSSCSYRFPPRN